MTYQEINEAVARRLGWEHVPADAGSDDYWRRAALRDNEGRIIRPAQFPFISDYSTSIEAAWEIPTYLISKGFEFNVDHPDWEEIKYFEEDRHKKWRCNISAPNGKIWKDAYADTAPMAICLAFLELPEVK